MLYKKKKKNKKKKKKNQNNNIFFKYMLNIYKVMEKLVDLALEMSQLSLI